MYLLAWLIDLFFLIHFFFRPVHASTPTSYNPSTNSLLSNHRGGSGLTYASGSNTATTTTAQQPSNQTLSGDSGRGSEEPRREGSHSDESCSMEYVHQAPNNVQGRVEFGLHEVR